MDTARRLPKCGYRGGIAPVIVDRLPALSPPARRPCSVAKRPAAARLETPIFA